MVTRRDVSPQEYQEMVARRATIAATLLPGARAALDESSEAVKTDWYDRAAYDAALEDLLALERELAELDDQLAEATVITPTKQRPERAIVGTTVTLRDVATGEIARHDLIASVEFHGAGDFVTAHSPLGQRLLGHRAGETIEVVTPAGRVRYQIEDVSWTGEDPPAAR